MIAQLEQVLNAVPQALAGFGGDMFQVWGGWAIWTVLMCSPVYLIAIGLSVFGVSGKTMNKVVSRTVQVNAVAALAPVILPILALWYGVPFVYRLATGQPARRRRNNQQGRQTVHHHHYYGNRPRRRDERRRRNN